MGTPRFLPVFKEEAVKQVPDRNCPAAEVADRLGVSAHSLYKWVKAVAPNNFAKQSKELLNATSEILRLSAQMWRLEDERVRMRVYKIREIARADILYYIEIFYNRSRLRSHLNGIGRGARKRRGMRPSVV